MTAFIDPPKKIPLFIKIGIWIAKKQTGKDLLIPKLLGWYPKIALSSGILESLVAHKDITISERILKLVRMKASFTTSCPFCIDMNSFEFEKYNISKDEIEVLQGIKDIQTINTLSTREKLAIIYSENISKTPLSFPEDFINELKQNFSPREIVVLAGTSAQVNYWARLIQGLGVPPAGFSENCIIDDRQ